MMMKIETAVQRIQNEVLPSFLLPIVLRWIVVGGILLRFYITYEDYDENYQRLWLITLVILIIYATVITVLSVKKPSLRDNRKWHLFQVLADTTFLSVLYFLTQFPPSDFFLFYFLPLLIAADNFKVREVIILFLIISVAFSLVLVFLTLSAMPEISTFVTFLEDFARDFLPRATFFLLFLFIAFMRGNRLQKQAEELEAVSSTALKIASNEALDSRLEAILEAATELLNAKGCKVYLRLPHQDLLVLVALRGIVSEYFRPGYIMPFENGMAGQVIISKEALIENDYPNSDYCVPELSEDFEAVIEVPLLFGEEVIGVLGVFDNATHRKFTKYDISVLQRLAQYAAVTIHDIQLVEQVKRHTETLQALTSAGEAMNADLDLNNTLSSIVESAWKLAVIYNEKPPLSCYIGTLDENEKHLEFRVAYPEPQIKEMSKRANLIDLEKGSIGIIGRAVITNSSQLISDVASDSDYIDFNPDTSTQLAVLIKSRKKTLGVISIEHSDKSAFQPELQENLEILAAQASAAIENAMLFQQIESQGERAERLRKQAEKLYAASVAISSARGLNRTAQTILEQLNKIIPYSRATLQIVKDDSRELAAKFNLDDNQVLPWLLRPISQDDLVREVLERNEICILSSLDSHQYWEPLTATSDIKSWIGIPLVYSDEPIGLITVDQLENVPYTEDHKSLLELFKNHATSVFQNAILFQKNAERVKELTQTKEDLEIIVTHLQDHRNLAMIGLVYGETIHFAKNKLGMAKTKADNIIQGFYDNDPDEINNNAAKIIKYINSYLKVLNDTQRKALQSPEPTPIDIHKTLDQVIKSKRISSYIKIDMEKCRVANPIIYAPERQLRQVLFVIVDNALNAMRSGKGVLGLETQSMPGNGEKFIRIAISDTGKGISETRQLNLFDMKEPDASRKGSGLGLVWARSFIRSFGGDISFKTSGDGTTMYILTPRDFRLAISIQPGSD